MNRSYSDAENALILSTLASDAQTAAELGVTLAAIRSRRRRLLKGKSSDSPLMPVVKLEALSQYTRDYLASIGWTQFDCQQCGGQKLGPATMTVCRTCRPMQRPERRKTQCDYGHPLTGENVYVRPNGKRECRTCRDEKVPMYKLRQRQRCAYGMPVEVDVVQVGA